MAARDVLIGLHVWNRLSGISCWIDDEKVFSGNAGDRHSVSVGRCVNDITPPECRSDYTDEVLMHLMAEPMRAIYTALLGEEDLSVRRCQMNFLKAGDLVGYHVDQDTNRDYLAMLIFMLNDGFQGGSFLFHHPQEVDRIFRPSKYSLLINWADVPHEVVKVTQGECRTIALFLSDAKGPAKNPRAMMKIESSYQT